MAKQKNRLARLKITWKWLLRKFEISFDSNYLNIDITEEEICNQLFERND